MLDVRGATPHWNHLEISKLIVVATISRKGRIQGNGLSAAENLKLILDNVAGFTIGIQEIIINHH